MEELPDWRLIWGLAALALTITAWIGDHRRMRRTNLDAVGCMPWTSVFLLALLATCLLLGLWARAWFAG
jgi:hypothetical protein